MTPPKHLPGRTRALSLALLLFLQAFPTFAAAPEVRPFNLPADTADKTLKLFSEQSGVEVLYGTGTASHVKTNAVAGELPPREALDRMLRGTGLVVTANEKTGTLTISRDPNGQRAAQPSDRPSDDHTSDTRVFKLQTFEVMESKLLNMDKPRSRDDAQPYVIFNRDTITTSGAINLDDFLRQRLSMNTVPMPAGQSVNTLNLRGYSSAVNLRGLGSGQTLILLDGHRLGDTGVGGSVSQPDINFIPLAAIERVEVLPTTASGIYGGGATGGVINIILRRDYAGAELGLTYQNTFDTDSGSRRVDFSTGFTLAGGKTNVLLAVTYSDAANMLVQDRKLVQNGVAAILANNPNSPTFFGATPPLGATSNIRSQDGSILVLKNGTSLKSAFTHVPAGYGGAATDSGAGLLRNAGTYEFGLANDATAGSTALPGKRAGLLNGPTLESLIATVRHRFSARLDGFLELGASNSIGQTFTSGVTSTFTVAANAPNNPFLQPLTVTVPNPAADEFVRTVGKERRVVAGVIAQLPAKWKAEADYTWRHYDIDVPGVTGLSAAGRTAVTNGTLDVLKDTNVYPFDLSPYLGKNIVLENVGTRTTDAAIRAGGPVGSLPGGPPELGIALERRDTKMGNSVQANYAANLNIYNPSLTQLVDSAYLEARIPVISAANRRPGVEALDLQVAARRDQYTSEGGTAVNGPIGGAIPTSLRARNRIVSTDPTIAVRWQPLEDLTLRTSYGTGFLPPGSTQLVTQTGISGTFLDPLRGNSSASLSNVPTGGNPNLKPEESKSWSAGIIATPRVIPNLRLSLDYTRIRKSDNIVNLSAQQLLDNEAFLPGRVTRGAKLSTDPAAWAGPVTLLNLSAVNFASAKLEAYDVQLDYSKKTQSAGDFSFFAMGTWTTHYVTQVVHTAAPLENAGVTRNNPLKFKANAGVTWMRGSWTFGWTSYFFDSYLVSTSTPVVLNQGNGGRVPSQMYHDIFGKYRFGTAVRPLLRGFEVQVGLRNVFNTKPPLDVSASSLYSTLADPRLLSYYVSVKKAF